MTLDKTIQRYRNNAEFEKKNGSLQGYMEFTQLADLLTELKELRRVTSNTKTQELTPPVNTITIPENATNRDVIMALYPNANYHNTETKTDGKIVKEVIMCNPELISASFWEDWLDSPYINPQMTKSTPNKDDTEELEL